MRRVVERCSACGVEHDHPVPACEACGGSVRPWCRAHSRDIGWLDGHACARCAEDAVRPAPRPQREPAPAHLPYHPAYDDRADLLPAAPDETYVELPAAESLAREEWTPLRHAWVPSGREVLRIMLWTTAACAAAGTGMGYLRADHAGEDLLRVPLTWGAAAGGLGMILGLCIVIVLFIESQTRR